MNYETLYNVAEISSYILYFLTLIGITTFAPQYLEHLRNFIKIGISLFLIYKFHPFIKNYKISKFDRRLIFSCALFLLLTTSLISLVSHYLNVFTGIKLKYI